MAASDSGGWSRTFGYDPYGNMWVTAASGVPLAGNTPTSNVYNSANNQINGGSYDAAGNQLAVSGDTLAYDANGHVTSATDNVTHNTETYIYDGGGQRIMKFGPSGETVYVYDAFGQLAAEYSTVPQNPPCATCYLSYDQRGDVRLVTDQNGNAVARHDYLPFGTEVPANIAGRNGQWGSTTDVEQKFTGQIRDTETGMDYFHARYYGSAFGRFTSPDPANAGADPTAPQSWNGYAYVGNNPLTVLDPTGLSQLTWTVNGFCGSTCLPGSGFDGTGGLGTFNGSGVGPANGGIPYQIGDQTPSEYEPSLTPTSGEPCGPSNLAGCLTSIQPPSTLAPPMPQLPARLPHGKGDSSARNPASSSPTHNNTQPVQPQPSKNVFTCASEAASYVSPAHLLHLIPGLKSGAGGFVADALTGNIFSGATDLITSFHTGGAGGHNVFYNMGQGLAAGPTLGLAPAFGRSLENTPLRGPTDILMTAIFGEYATGVGEVKLGYDLVTYVGAAGGCLFGVIP